MKKPGVMASVILGLGLAIDGCDFFSQDPDIIPTVPTGTSGRIEIGCDMNEDAVGDGLWIQITRSPNAEPQEYVKGLRVLNQTANGSILSHNTNHGFDWRWIKQDDYPDENHDLNNALPVPAFMTMPESHGSR